MPASNAHATNSLWGIPIPDGVLTSDEDMYVKSMPISIPTHEWICSEMDRIWYQMGLNSRLPLDDQPVDEFYRHPIWIVNGIFSLVDAESQLHRRAIADAISHLGPSRVLEVGGGIGDLALKVSALTPSVTVHIYEPFPSRVAQERVRTNPNVAFVSSIQGPYDVVVAQDVLEHVGDPVGLAVAVAESLRPSGVAIFANNFRPIIACHLPRTFHLRLTFGLVMKALGFRARGGVPLAPHAQQFELSGALNVERARLAEQCSAYLWPLSAAALSVGRRLRAGWREVGLR